MPRMPRMTISAPREVPQEFVWLCHRRDKSASEVVREFIEGFVDSRFAEIEARDAAVSELSVFDGRGNQRNQVNFVREMTELERERSRFAQRAAALNEIWLHGLPEGTPLAQLQVLLGDPPTAVDLDLQCKALPVPRAGKGKESQTGPINDEAVPSLPR